MFKERHGEAEVEDCCSQSLCFKSGQLQVMAHFVGKKFSEFLEDCYFSKEYAQFYAFSFKKIGIESPEELRAISTENEFEEMMKSINIDSSRYGDKLKLKRAWEKVKSSNLREKPQNGVMLHSKVKKSNRRSKRKSVSFEDDEWNELKPFLSRAQYYKEEKRRILERAERSKNEIRKEFKSKIQAIDKRTCEKIKKFQIECDETSDSEKTKSNESHNKMNKYQQNTTMSPNSSSSYSSSDTNEQILKASVIHEQHDQDLDEDIVVLNPKKIKKSTVSKQRKIIPNYAKQSHSRKRKRMSYDGDNEKEFNYFPAHTPKRRKSRRRSSLSFSPVQPAPVSTTQIIAEQTDDDSHYQSPFKRRKLTQTQMTPIFEESDIDLT